jgi:hypothetical protein
MMPGNAFTASDTAAATKLKLQQPVAQKNGNAPNDNPVAFFP